MRFTVALAFGLSLMSSAFAFDPVVAVQRWQAADSQCRMEADETACETRAKYTKELSENGVCFNNDEYEWYICAPRS